MTNGNGNSSGNGNSNASDSSSNNSGSDSNTSTTTTDGNVNDNSSESGSSSGSDSSDDNDSSTGSNTGSTDDSVVDTVTDTVGSVLGLSRPASTVETHDVAWGNWAAPVEDNWLVIQKSEDGLVRIDTGDYFADVNPTSVASMKGAYQYQTGIASAFIGSGSAGDISSLAASMAVDFDSGLISAGELNVQAADQIWAVHFEGMIDNGTVELQSLDGSLYDATGLLSNQIEAQIGGVFTGENAEAFVGGFDLYDQLNEFNEVNGLFTIER